MRLRLLRLAFLGLLLGYASCKSHNNHHHKNHQKRHKQSNHHHQTRIVGGTNALIENYSYMVSVLYNGKHICGGSIITPSFVVTAAHCTFGHNASTMAIRAGSSFKNQGGVLVGIYFIHQHPNFNPQGNYFDISVLELNQPLVYGKSIGFIDLPYPGEEVYAFVFGVTAGFGNVDNKGTQADQLNAVSIATLDQFQCNQFYPDVTYLQFCAGSSMFGGKGPCIGDSGGPFVVNGKLAGIAAFDKSCAQAVYPTVFTKISSVRTFISARAGI